MSDQDLIAPCGMNCALCSKFLAYKNNLKRSSCRGCRIENQSCDYLFGKCEGINHGITTGNASFCFKCELYPCKGLKRMDKRYRENYMISTVGNLEKIKNEGSERLIEEHREKFRCERCGDLISVHNRKCFRCDEITKLVEKPCG